MAKYWRTLYFDWGFMNNQRISFPKGFRVVDLRKDYTNPSITIVYDDPYAPMVVVLFKIRRWRWWWHRGTYIGSLKDMGRIRHFYYLVNA